MKQLLYTLFCISMIIVSCSKDDEPKSSNDTIVGTWIMERFCHSPGDASCPWETPTNEYTYTFHADGRYSNVGMSQSCTGKYKIAQDTSGKDFHLIEFTEHKGESSCSDHKMWLHYQKDGKIQISPICTEQCTHVYRKK